MISRRLLLLDAAAALAVVFAYLTFASFDGSDGTPAFTGPAWLGWLVAVCAGVPISVRRLWPVPATAMVVIGCAAASVLDITREPFIPAALALYAVGALEASRRSVATLVAALAVSTGGLVAGTYIITPSENLAGMAWLLCVVWLITAGGWAAGVAVRRRRFANERAAASDRQRAAAEERLRIAREIHDIVSHNLSLIAVQAGVANHVAAEQPEHARAALQSIEAASRNALSEMRGVLEVLRSGPPTPDSVDHPPNPGLDGLAGLAERTRDAGVPVDLTVDVSRPLPTGVELAVYRIVQEALTNVVKHAAPARCTVRIAADSEEISVRVTDDGRRTGLPGAGHGLAGVRERAMMYGGQLTAGPGPNGGFTLHATVPYQRTGVR